LPNENGVYSDQGAPGVRIADPGLEVIGANQLRLPALGPERLEPVSPLSSCLGRCIDRIFVLFPLVIWTDLAMSPAIASVFPAAVTVLGGNAWRSSSCWVKTDCGERCATTKPTIMRNEITKAKTTYCYSLCRLKQSVENRVRYRERLGGLLKY
jgi:hypothetical protein